MNPNVERGLRKAFMRRLVSTPRGREHILSLMVAAEEGDESGVFDAENDAQWQQAVETFARIEDRAFKAVGLTTIAHALETGLLDAPSVVRHLVRMLRSINSYPRWWFTS